MDSKIHQLHIYFFPVMASGHMIPLVDMAKQFASHGVKATIVLTPRNAVLFTETIERYIDFGLPICIRQVQFPSDASGLPIGCEDLASVTSPEMRLNFIKALDMFQEPLQQLLEEDQPDCIVADFFFSWTTEIASKLEIPRLVFHGTGVFPLCVTHSLMQHQPYKNIESETETFVIPGLPDTIKLSIQQIPEEWRETSVSHVVNMFEKGMKSELTSYGVIVNSFHELESAYVELYKEVMGRKKTWLVGPVSLCNRNNKDKAQRGKKASIDENECLNWLNSKKPNSVLYICFGSMSNFSPAQLYEIATGLEAAEQEFIWVVRKEKVDNKEQETWLPEGYEQRMEGKGLIIRGWAPQVLILDHEAVGAFVTHCGWNSLQEGVSAGVPMVTWPLYAEQFYNEKLATDVLRTGVAVGAQQWSKRTIEYKVSVQSNDIARAVRQVMVGEEAEEMRRRARALGDAAKRAVEEGGSSYMDLNSLLAELRIKRS